MNIEVLKQEKDEVELSIDNLTVAEILRVYLNEQGVEFAAWRRVHPNKPLVMRVKNQGVKKTIGEAIDKIEKDLENISALVKKKQG